MPILSAYIFPHGALTLDPSRFPEYPELQILHNNISKIALEIYNLNPDNILLITPHGISLSKTYGIYCNLQGSGTAEWQGDWKEFEAHIDLDLLESKNICDFIESKKIIKMEQISAFGSTTQIPLRWGEVIPIWFIEYAYKKYSNKKMPNFIIISIPMKRLVEIEDMMGECLLLGDIIAEYFQENKKKIIILISGDLAHTHSVPKDCLLKSPQNYPVKDDAEIFDKAIETWAKDPLNNESTLIDCGKLVKEYLSCGYSGFLILQGLLRNIEKNSKIKITSDVLCNFHPTYYGMMVAKFNF